MGLMSADESQSISPLRSVETQSLEALQAHLACIEKLIEQFVRLAPTLPSDKEQDECWERAQALQRDARLTRQAITRLRESETPQIHERTD